MSEIGKNIKIAPSILSADFSCLEDSIESVESTEWLHLDVMDGHFVPNLTFGPCVIRSIREKSDHVFDTHLMISQPGKYAEEFAEAGSDMITFHAEAVDDAESVIETIEDCGVQVGVSL
ncbi:MAG: ribulose-phosphate 3-epimerase, partial [Candidatus Thermoplasmatota archaeon]